jgi:hypothetical protein
MMFFKRTFETPARSHQFPLAPNEGINLDLKVMYVAVPKTGSTSIRSHFRAKGPFLFDTPHLSINQLRQVLHFWALSQAVGRCREFPTDSDAVLSELEVYEKAESIFSSCLKLGSVRNPFARAISLYFRAEGIQMRTKIGFDQFVDQLAFASDTCVHPTRMRNQLDWFLDRKGGELLVDRILKLENLGNDLAQLSTDFPHLGRISNTYRRVNPNSESSNYREFYTNSSRKSVEKVFSKDLEFFSYTF